jgi:hypothetical protein
MGSAFGCISRKDLENASATDVGLYVQSDILFPSILGNESKKGKAFRACNAWYKIK